MNWRCVPSIFIKYHAYQSLSCATAINTSGQSARTVCERSWVRVPVGSCAFSSPMTFGGSVWVCARAVSRKGTVSSVPAWFRANSGTNLIKQGEVVTGRPCGSVAQWSEYSLGMREFLGSSPGRAMCFLFPCDSWWLSVGPCSCCEQQRDCLVGSGMAPNRFLDESY